MTKTRRWLLCLAVCSSYMLAAAMPAHAAGSTSVELDPKDVGSSSRPSAHKDCGTNPTGGLAWHFNLQQLDSGTSAASLSVSFENSGTENGTGTPQGVGQSQHIIVYTDVEDTILGATATVDEQTGTPKLMFTHVSKGCTSSGGDEGGDDGDGLDPPSELTCDTGLVATDTNDDGVTDTCVTIDADPIDDIDDIGDDIGGSSDIVCDAGSTAIDSDADEVLDTCVLDDVSGDGSIGSGDEEVVNDPIGDGSIDDDTDIETVASGTNSGGTTVLAERTELGALAKTGSAPIGIARIGSLLLIAGAAMRMRFTFRRPVTFGGSAALALALYGATASRTLCSIERNRRTTR